MKGSEVVGGISTIISEHLLNHIKRYHFYSCLLNLSLKSEKRRKPRESAQLRAQVGIK